MMEPTGKYIIAIVLLAICNMGSGQSIVINEVQYQNDTTLFDSEGNTPDWIELYNVGTTAVNLKGYQLSDDEELSDRWGFPEILIYPGQYLIVFASGRDINVGNELHSDFKLGLMSDPLFLINRKGEVVDEVSKQCVPPGMSIGYSTDGQGNKVILTPSPGVSNNYQRIITIDYKPDSLTVSQQSGFYSSGLGLELSNIHSGNTIVYTLNGDDPEYNSTTYESAILLDDISSYENRFANKVDAGEKPGNMISKASILRARIYSQGCPASNTVSNTYFISNNEAFDYKSIPVVSVITDKDNLFDKDEGIYTIGNHDNYNQHGKEWERPIHIEVFDSLRNRIIDQDAGIRIHGRASRGAPQKSLRLYAKSEYGKEAFEYPFFKQKPHLKSFKTLLLRSTRGWSGTLFKDELCQYLVEDMNVDYAAAETAVLFINGEYWGIYSLRERHDGHYVSNNYNVPGPDLDIIGYDPMGLMVESGTINNYNSLLDLLENANPDDPEYYNELKKSINVDAFTDYYIAQLYLANTDFPNNNQELWKFRTDTSKWRLFFFDMDATMSRIDYNLLSEYNNSFEDLNRYDSFSTAILKQLLKNAGFRNQFYAKYLFHLSNTFSTERVVEKINEFQRLYEPLATDHIYRWGNPSDYNKWQHNVDMLRLFAVQRPTIVQGQLAGNFGNPFAVYPNPSDGRFYINFYNNNSLKNISMVNMNGRTMFRKRILESETFVDGQLDPGVYILKVDFERYSYTQRINIVR